MSSVIVIFVDRVVTSALHRESVSIIGVVSLLAEALFLEFASVEPERSLC